MLSKTASKIMRVLIHQDDEFITYERIAGMLEISERSVHNYMKEAAEFCEENGYRLFFRGGEGGWLSNDPPEGKGGLSSGRTAQKRIGTLISERPDPL